MKFDLEANAYRRRIRVTTVEPGVVVSALEDDFHVFIVTLRHDGTQVIDVECESRRWPWSTCPAAAESLKALAGMPLSRRFTAAGEPFFSVPLGTLPSGRSLTVHLTFTSPFNALAPLTSRAVTPILPAYPGSVAPQRLTARDGENSTRGRRL